MPIISHLGNAVQFASHMVAEGLLKGHVDVSFSSATKLHMCQSLAAMRRSGKEKGALPVFKPNSTESFLLIHFAG